MVGSEFVVLVFSPSVVRHVDINLARYATRGVVSSARTSAHRSAKETRHTVSEGWSTKNVFGRLGSLHKSPAQEGRTPWYTYLTLYSPMWRWFGATWYKRLLLENIRSRGTYPAEHGVEKTEGAARSRNARWSTRNGDPQNRANAAEVHGR